MQTVRLTIQAQGPVHVVHFSDGNDNVRGVSSGVDVSQQVKQADLELTALLEQLKGFQDNKGILISHSLQPAGQEGANHARAPDAAAGKLTGGDRRASVAITAEASGGERAAKGEGGTGIVKGMMKKLRRPSASHFQRSTAIGVEASTASRTLRKQKSFPLLALTPSPSKEYAGSLADLSPESTLRRASTGSAMHGASSSGMLDDAALLGMPPASLAADTPSSLDSPIRADGMRVERESDRNMISVHRGDPGRWNHYNSTFEPQRVDDASAAFSRSAQRAANRLQQLGVTRAQPRQGHSRAVAESDSSSDGSPGRLEDEVQQADESSGTDSGSDAHDQDATESWALPAQINSSELQMFAPGTASLQRVQSRKDRKVAFRGRNNTAVAEDVSDVLQQVTSLIRTQQSTDFQSAESYGLAEDSEATSHPAVRPSRLPADV